MQDIEKLCLGCMKIKTRGEKQCPYCGFDAQKYEKNSRWLPLQHILNGKYLLGKVIGEGGFGITYIGWDLNMEVRIAIKEYFPVGLASRELSNRSRYTISALTGEKRSYYSHGLQKFTEEARSLAKFYQLDGIVSVKDFFYENETAYMVMEYVDGVTMKEYLNAHGGRLAATEALQLLEPVIRSLEVIHREQIIHRDISPDNLMITRDGHIKLIDFGAARMSCKDENHTFTIILKHGYAPLEQYQTKGKQGPWTDVYALCATIYRIIAGVLPPNAMDRIVKDELKSFEQTGCKVPAGLTEIVIKNGMALQVSKRYQNMEDLYAALYQGKNISRTVKDAEQGRASGDRKMSYAGIIAVICGSGVLLAAGIWFPLRTRNTGQKQAEVLTATMQSEKETAQSETEKQESEKETLQSEKETLQSEKETLQSEKEIMLGTEKSVIETEIETEIQTEEVVIENKDQALFYKQCNSIKDAQPGDTIVFGAFEQDNNPSNGKEEIEWLVLDREDNKICVISKKALACHNYQDEFENTTWADSQIRSWLNTEFLKDAFSQYHQKLILETNVKAEKVSNYDTDPGADTVDRLYFLSESEVKKYFPTDAERTCQPTVYAKVQGAYLKSLNGWWWLRNPGKDGKHLAVVYTDGTVKTEGYRTYVEDGTVRPVMWLDISDISKEEVPDRWFEKESCKGVVALSASFCDVPEAESYKEPVGPGGEEKEFAYEVGGIGETTGLVEQKVNLQVSEYVRDILLERGYQVVMLREEGAAKLSPMNRAIAAGESGADIMVIISCRKRQDIGQRGAMAYTQHKDNPYVSNLYPECKRLAESLLSEYCAEGIFENNGIHKTDNVVAINWSNIPVANILLGCISDPEDEQKLVDENNWYAMAEGIANGIEHYYMGR